MYDLQTLNSFLPQNLITNYISPACQNGVRALMLDTYDFEGDIWLCHSFGGQCYDYTKFVPSFVYLGDI